MPCVKFAWKYEIVEPTTLYGSFNSWTYGIGMHHDLTENSMICHTIMEPGTYQYKFKVGENWFYDMNEPTTTDEMATLITLS